MGIENPQEYWQKRYKAQGRKTTGFVGHNDEQNEACYKERIRFIGKTIKHYIKGKNVLDFGCGVGRYFDLISTYARSYTGYDIHDWAIYECLTMYLDPNSLFIHDFVRDEPLHTEVLFTATVLQHNTDVEVSRILSKYKDAETFLLYEFTGKTQAAHMAQRTVKDYERLAGKQLINSHSHVVHGEEHTLMILQ